MRRIIVTGAGGFVGHHLTKRLKAEGNFVVGVDLKHTMFEDSPADHFEIMDLTYSHSLRKLLLRYPDVDDVYHLAALMGGIGFIGRDKFGVASENALIDASVLRASEEARVKRFFFSSSACVYNQTLQHGDGDVSLCEADAWPANPEPGYGLEKLFMEEMCGYADEQGTIATRVARFHNVYGPLGTFEGGKEKAPAAVCRKIAAAKDGDEIEVWGDGAQRRSFTYIDDCIEGIRRLMESDCSIPMNIGSDEAVTIDELVDRVAWIAGKKIGKKYLAGEPIGVRNRNSNNEKIKRVLGWKPSTALTVGLGLTYTWIASQVQLEAVGK